MKASTKKVLGVLVALLILAALGAGAWFLVKRYNEDYKDDVNKNAYYKLGDSPYRLGWPYYGLYDYSGPPYTYYHAGYTPYPYRNWYASYPYRSWWRWGIW